jgi:hypothetical protein
MDEHKELFIWKKEHEQYFIRELLVTEPYMFKPKTTGLEVVNGKPKQA